MYNWRTSKVELILTAHGVLLPLSMGNCPALTSFIGHSANWYSVVAGLPSWSPAQRTAFPLEWTHPWRPFECGASAGRVLCWGILLQPQMKKRLGYFWFKASKGVISNCLFNCSICSLSSNSLFFCFGAKCCIVNPKSGWSSESVRELLKISVSRLPTHKFWFIKSWLG